MAFCHSYCSIRTIVSGLFFLPAFLSSLAIAASSRFLSRHPMSPSPSQPAAIASPPRPDSAITIRVAQQKDVSILADLLTASFHSPAGWLGWLYPLLRAGIYEDLNHRLRQPSQHYTCLVAIDPAVDGGASERASRQGTQRGSQQNSAQPSVAMIPPACFWPRAKNSPQNSRQDITVVGTVEISARSQFPLGWGEPSYLYISNLAIAEPYRRQGVATALLAECERSAKRWGFTAIYLHVLEDNQAARRLYQGVGYRTESILADWFSRLFGRSRRLLMRKNLGAHR